MACTKSESFAPPTASCVMSPISSEISLVLLTSVETVSDKFIIDFDHYESKGRLPPLLV